MTRYARQIMVPGVGLEGQARLASAHVLVIGAGGLGCPALQYLAGAGVGQITLIDPDCVEESNLHRQPLYEMSDLGRPKVLAAQDHIAAAHPAVALIARKEALHPRNAEVLIQDVDVVLDAADSFAVSYILSDTCKRLETPLIAASVLGQTGYVGGFCGSAPSLRAIFPDLPQTNATCSTAGVLGPVVGSIGALQAQMALQVLLGSEPSPLGRLITVDMQKFQFGGFLFNDAAEPAVSMPFVSLSDIRAGDHVVELRDVTETPTCLVSHAERVAPDAVEQLNLDPASRVILCCATGLRAWRAAKRLAEVSEVQVALLAESACG